MVQVISIAFHDSHFVDVQTSLSTVFVFLISELILHSMMTTFSGL